MNEPSPAVLVIDDEAQIRRFLRAGFELEGFSVLEADNATEGLRSLTLRAIDLVIGPRITGADVHPVMQPELVVRDSSGPVPEVKEGA